MTVGLEMEFADIWRNEITLPEGCKWAPDEKIVVNSDGRAWDCRPKSDYLRGGEINTPPTKTIKEQMKVVEKSLKLVEINIFKNGGNPLNYRTMLHTHVGIPKEEITLELLKKLQDYGYRNFDRMKKITMNGQPRKKMWAACWAANEEKMVTDWKHEYLMNAKTIQEFRDAFFYSKAGKKAHVTFFRQGFNVYSLFKHGTIEFRIFWQTMEASQIKTALEFSHNVIEDALGKQDSFYQIEEYYLQKIFPPQIDFDPVLEEGFQKTKW
jgi:hypothetical protein